MTDALNIDTIADTLDVVAEWLISAYGSRIAAVSLDIEGHYGPLSDCYGIVPITLERGLDADGRLETRETLPTREVCKHAEALFQRLCPGLCFDHDNARDVRHVARSRLVRFSDVSSHRRIELRRLYGAPSGLPERRGDV